MSGNIKNPPHVSAFLFNNMTLAIKKLIYGVAKIVATIAVVLLLWWFFALAANNSLVLPQPWEVLKITFGMLGESSVYVALLRTFLRAAIAFCVSFVLSGALCILAQLFVCAKPFVDGFVTFLRAVPTMSVILLAMIAFRSGTVPVFVAVLVALPIIYAAFTREVTSEERLADVCAVFGVTRIKKLRFVLFPQMKRAVLSQISETLPFCIKIVIAGEVMALPRLGLGREMYIAKVNIETSRVLALTILALVLCYAITGLCKMIYKRKQKNIEK